jgi:hypothetical protein
MKMEPAVCCGAKPRYILSLAAPSRNKSLTIFIKVNWINSAIAKSLHQHEFLVMVDT